ncbi:MAG: hypothetical protein J3Q66DRAFT_362018 [Benniella sp.]|nr:MAG: hypothetical protein J3Q66DRAFT_362018 [Benniella sp.]
MSVGAMRFSSQYLSPSASLHLWRLWMRNLFRPFSEAVLRGRSQRPFSEAVLRGFSDRLQADASSADTSMRIHSLVSLIRITPTTAARHTAVVALASLFGVDWSRGPTVTSSGSHGLLSYLASPINPRAMASVKNPAPLTLIDHCLGGAAGSAVHAIVTLGRKTPFMCPDLSEVWWACRPWPILLELLEELEGIFQVDGEKAE